MNYSAWPELQQPQPQPQTPVPSFAPSVPSYSHYIYPNPPSSSSSVPQSSLEPVLNPPGVDSYAPLTNANSIAQLGHETLANYSSYAHGHVADSTALSVASGYYVDLNGQNWAAREAVRQYGADPVSYAADISMPLNGSEQLAVTNPNMAWLINPATQPHGNGTWKKYPKKPKTKIVPPANCDVCKIECTSKEVLDQHKLGKKHKKNLEKLRESLNLPRIHLPSGPSNPFIGPKVQNDNSKSASAKKSKRKTVETPENLEIKKKKVLEGGAASEAVRVCAVCNVVCNSDVVYNYHLQGQKHAAMVKKASQHAYSSAR
ncbi:hypothetical protein RIF29_14397 [Crotalaria pallida]|uniref:Uncharacterized protein n=1 Tax=Crotalaria pallida TaxID=3830 RepID=A0AAN9FK06_CROPI